MCELNTSKFFPVTLTPHFSPLMEKNLFSDLTLTPNLILTLPLLITNWLNLESKQYFLLTKAVGKKQKKSRKLNRSNLKLWQWCRLHCLVSSSRSAHSHSWLTGWLHAHRGPTSMIPERQSCSHFPFICTHESPEDRKHLYGCIFLKSFRSDLIVWHWNEDKFKLFRIPARQDADNVQSSQRALL